MEGKGEEGTGEGRGKVSRGEGRNVCGGAGTSEKEEGERILFVAP